MDAAALATMTTNQTGSSSSKPRRIVLAGAVSAAISTTVLGFVWKEKPFFAGVAVALYITGGIRAFPWKTPVRKAISIGIFVGIVVSSALFYWDFL
jgi:hypothetical protein